MNKSIILPSKSLLSHIGNKSFKDFIQNKLKGELLTLVRLHLITYPEGE